MTAADSRGGLRLGIDIGGTFTDAVAVGDDGTVTAHKVPTTPSALADGFLTAVDAALSERGATPGSVASVAHATTAATNAIIEGTGPPVALVVTEGFRDILEIARQIRPDLFDLRRHKPPPLVPRDRVFEIAERLGPAGEVLRPLDTQDLVALTERVRRSGVAAVVVCLLHSYGNAAHEQAVTSHLRAALPHVDVTASAEVWPEFREYFRASTAIINAMVKPVLHTYLREVADGLQARAITAPLWVMQSGGGVASASAAAELPVQLIESGPAAGLLYAAHVGRQLGHANLVSFEVGGTTAKVGLVVNHEPAVTADFEVGAEAAAGSGRGRASGYPIKTPVLDLVEIGAGGGSIAWIDAGGALRVGPRSAGADPGPACYGRGGGHPTVTDANLVLGRIDPDRFLGGAMPLDLAAAEAAIDRRCAGPLGVDVPQVAEAIVAAATASMARALRRVTVERGHDPRDFVLLAFGGAGPLHAATLADEVGFAHVVVPQHPGVLGAAGLLVAPVQAVAASTALMPLERAGDDGRFVGLVDSATRALQAQGVAADDTDVVRTLDLRYVGQSFELAVEVPREGPVDAEEMGALFHRQHHRAYGHAAPAEPVEIVTWRVTARQRRRPDLTMGTRAMPARPATAPRGGGPVVAGGSPAVVDRADLGAADVVAGPAVITEAHCTTYVPAGWGAHVDVQLNLTLRPQPARG